MSGYKKVKDISWTKLDGKVIILDTRDGRQFHELDEVATFLWDELDHISEQDELVDKLTDEYDVHRDHAKRDIELFIDSLHAKKLLL